MDGREGISSGGGVTVMGADAPSNFHVAARNENPSQVGGSGSVATSVSVALAGTAVKKKRGRPRKYGPDGSVSLALSPMPISASAPSVPSVPSAGSGDFSAKRGRGRPAGSMNKPQPKMEMENLGNE
ncbi:AT hook [Macleaya cordata]|uniref:AT-hook motif nuclear-localized protein n=1 Tax=Macleaya cordata TaxID=56857 RepID=A0A200QB57_MACCD|nr:AT hook [Macleaya cordata]